MIVKVQLSVSTTEDNTQMLVYNKSRRYLYQADATEEVEKLMGKELKKYFKVKLIDDGLGNKQIQLHNEVKCQDW